MNTDTFKEEIQRGENLFQNGKIDAAFEIFESVLEKDPGNIPALNNRGVALNKLGRYQEAIQAFLGVLEKDKENANAVFNLIANYFATGKLNEAQDIFSRYGPCLSQDEFKMVQMDLEKLKSNKVKVPIYAYEHIQERVTKILRKKIFFIVGLPKSGTTWLMRVLDGHPKIYCSGESHFSDELAPLLQHSVDVYNKNIVRRNIHQTHYPHFTNENLEHMFVTAIGLLFSNWVGDSNVQCIGDKTPDHTEAMPLLARLFPKSKFIHIIRDGRDMAVSAWFHSLRDHPTTFKQRFPELRDFLGVSGKIWVSVLQKARSFGQAYPDRYFEVRYEDLHRDPNSIVQQLLEFLGVDSASAMVDQCREAASFEKLSRGRKRGHEDRNAFFRKGIIGDWKNHFDQTCLDTFMQYGGDLLRELGYE